jgi:lipopolysaccharide/colanic/teichoic acid biosynthesis glycosyltransferase
MTRFMDIVLSVAILCVMSPVFIMIALAVWLDSGRPIFFSQERVGKDFRRFKLWKFRTMQVHHQGPRLTVRGDTRVTRVGSILRSTKLDELPQFLNVLFGEMGVVGPRPELAEYVALYEERFQRILSVRPGITSVASIKFRNEEAILSQSSNPIRTYCEDLLPEKLDLSEKYLQDRSLWGDLSIIAQTVVAVLFSGRSANESAQKA